MIFSFTSGKYSVQEFKEFKEFRSSGVQEFRSSGVQEFRSSGLRLTRQLQVDKASINL
jgi:hypothetical protein